MSADQALGKAKDDTGGSSAIATTKGLAGGSSIPASPEPGQGLRDTRILIPSQPHALKGGSEKQM